jgi:hypothetical protein
MSADLIIAKNDTCKVYFPCGDLKYPEVRYKNKIYEKKFDSLQISMIRRKYEEVGRSAFLDLFDKTDR